MLLEVVRKNLIDVLLSRVAHCTYHLHHADLLMDKHLKNHGVLRLFELLKERHITNPYSQASWDMSVWVS